MAVKFVLTGGSSHSGECESSAVRLFLNLDCHRDFAIVIHRCSDEMWWHLMEDVVEEGGVERGMRQ
jgi:hypothetical protein